MTNGYHIAAGLGILALVGCADTTGQVVPTSHHTYVVSSHGDIGISPTTPEEANAYKEASAFCEKQNRELKLVGERDIYGDFGAYPSVELEFQCVPRK